MRIALSPAQKKWVHTGAVGFVTGVLTYLSGWVVGFPVPAPRALILAILVAGVSRAAGALLAKAP